MDYTIEGLREHIEQLNVLPEQIDKAVARQMNQLGNEWLGECQRLTPYDTGKLRQSFRLKKAYKVQDETVISIYNNMEYAAAVEFGHRQEPGRYVPMIQKRLKRSWVQGHHMLEKSRQKAYLSLGKVAKRALEEVNNDYSK